MRALIVRSHQGGAASVSLEQAPMPSPRPGQVLIRVAAAPVNPNDLLALKNTYEVDKPLGTVAGFEGAGTVVAGSGTMARLLKGRRVAFAASDGSGAWAQFALAEATRCAPLRGKVSDEEGATMLTNPLTATVLLEQARREGHRAVVQTAAAGALGRMVARLALELRVPMIHVVRSPAQVSALRALGAEQVLDSSTAGFEAALEEHCHRLRATLALDPVGGPLTVTVLRALPPGGVVRLFGWLSGGSLDVSPGELLFERKRLEGFTMYQWLEATSMLRQLRTVTWAQARLRGALATEVRARVPLEGFRDALSDYERSMSGGKILFLPQG